MKAYVIKRDDGKYFTGGISADLIENNFTKSIAKAKIYVRWSNALEQLKYLTVSLTRKGIEARARLVRVEVQEIQEQGNESSS